MLMRWQYMVMVFISISGVAGAQGKSTYTGFPSLVWPKLYNITFEKARDQHGEYEKPVFTEKVKALEGKIISLPGYMVPFESGNTGTTFMLSSLPLNACFFCGVGGPETVIEVQLSQSTAYREKPIEVRGVLRLNDKDPDKMIYRLEKAEIIGDAGL